PHSRRAALQPRIPLAAGEADRAIAILESLPRRASPIPALLGRAYLESGDAGRALEVTGTGAQEDAEPAQALNLAKLRLKAAAALGDGNRAVEVVEPIIARYRSDSAIQRLALRALLANDAIEDAARLIAGLEPQSAPSDAMLAGFIARALRGGHVAALVASLPALERLTASRLDTLLARGWKNVGSAEDRTRAVAALGEMVAQSGSLMLSVQASWLLSAEGRVQEAVDLARRIRAQTASTGNEAALQIDRAEADGRLPKIPNADVLMNWLEIPEAERETWQRSVGLAALERKRRRAQWIAQPETWEEFVAAVTPKAAPELQALSAAGKPGILAITHAGELMGTLACFLHWGVPVEIIGGHPIHKALLDGGEHFNPLEPNASGTRIARDVVRHLRQGRIVGLAGDGRNGSTFYPVEHRGARFDLPDSVPQIAYRKEVPIFWAATYWRDGRIECDTRPGPSPRPGESYENFRARWFDFVLEASHAICRADPANVFPIASRIRAAR
ncbi:hypothetical protein, partial [Stappia sp.]|uniref:hypothetical protein n=1 Tax=Stappia sp. TaxID=1870903 RepID=UPI003A998442